MSKANGGVTDLGTGKPVQVEHKPIHVGMVELLQNAAAQVAAARELSQKLPLHPNPGLIMGQILAANVGAIESLTQAMGCAYNLFAIGMNAPMEMRKIGGERERPEA